MIYHYFDVEIAEGVWAQFRRNVITRALFVFRFSVCDAGNAWHAPGYGWGRWERV